jgi:hypothetical protein
MPANEQLKQMDDAAAEARKELVAHLEEWTARDVVKWWAGWYLKAGHKRLGRLLVELAKQKKE